MHAPLHLLAVSPPSGPEEEEAEDEEEGDEGDEGEEGEEGEEELFCIEMDKATQLSAGPWTR